jgi:hypothetical protein
MGRQRREEMKLWTLTTVRFCKILGRDDKPVESFDSRCVGVFRKADEAIDVALNNYGDIYECGYYPLLVIEKTTTGLYPFHGGDFEQYWYTWVGDEETGGYQPTERPEMFKNTVGWGIG